MKIETEITRMKTSASSSSVDYSSSHDYEDCITWVNASNGKLHSQAWVAWAPSDSYPTPTYVGRAAHNGGLFPATLLPHKGVAHVPWGGQNYEKDSYQVKDNYISWGKLFPFIFLCHLAF